MSADNVSLKKGDMITYSCNISEQSFQRTSSIGNRHTEVFHDKVYLTFLY